MRHMIFTIFAIKYKNSCTFNKRSVVNFVKNQFCQIIWNIVELLTGWKWTMNNKNELLRQLPKLDKLIRHESFAEFNQELLKIAARDVIEKLRQDIITDSVAMPENTKIIDDIKTAYAALAKGTLYKVINATGVPIHTNLGRAPLPEDTLSEAIEIACGYSNLEYDVEKG